MIHSVVSLRGLLNNIIVVVIIIIIIIIIITQPIYLS